MAGMQTAQTRASQWARATLEQDIVILDTETTGLWPEDEIVEIAVIDRNGTVLLNQRIQPNEPKRLLRRDQKGKCAADIHGITPDMLAGQPRFPEVYPRLNEVISLKPAVIYNADYDMRMLSQDCDRHRLSLPLIYPVCAMKQFAAFRGMSGKYPGEYRWVRLEEAVAQVRVPRGTFDAHAHSALGDCLRTLAVLRGMAAEAL